MWFRSQCKISEPLDDHFREEKNTERKENKNSGHYIPHATPKVSAWISLRPILTKVNEVSNSNSGVGLDLHLSSSGLATKSLWQSFYNLQGESKNGNGLVALIFVLKIKEFLMHPNKMYKREKVSGENSLGNKYASFYIFTPNLSV